MIMLLRRAVPPYISLYRTTVAISLFRGILTAVHSVEPASGKPNPGKYKFRLSLKVDKVERPLEDVVSLNLLVDPKNLEFIVL